ncbi:MAG TPA: hypothetical protein VF157_07390 [Chloroflexota bacterium]
MRDDVDQAVVVDVLAACLTSDEQETGDLFEFLAKKLEARARLAARRTCRRVIHR